MGWSIDPVRGKLIISDTSTTQADLQKIADQIIERGNRMADVSSVRTSLPIVFAGLEFHETDTDLIYTYSSVSPAGWKVTGAVGLIRETINWINTGYIGGGATQATILFASKPFARRVMVDIAGFVSPQSAGDGGLSITVDAGTLVKDPGGQERVYANIGSQFYGYHQMAYVDIPASTAVTVTIKNVSSVPSAFQVGVRTRTLIPGEY